LTRIAINFILASAIVFSGCKQQAAPPKGAGGMPAFPVTVTKAAQQSVPTELRVVGTVEASAVVQIKSQIAGQLVGVEFAEGQNVADMHVVSPSVYPDDRIYRWVAKGKWHRSSDVYRTERGLA